MKWMKSKRARVMDFFRSIDKDGSGQIPRRQFIDEIIKSSKLCCVSVAHFMFLYCSIMRNATMPALIVA